MEPLKHTRRTSETPAVRIGETLAVGIGETLVVGNCWMRVLALEDGRVTFRIETPSELPVASVKPEDASEESLVVDYKWGRSPAQMVEDKLARMLKDGSMPVSHVQMRRLLEARTGVGKPVTTSQVAASLDAKVFETAERLSPSELQEFIAGVLTLRAQRVAPVAPARESELLLRINEGLPEDLSRRLESLQTKREAETLSDEEHQELIRLGDEVEKKELSRLEALAELASVRGMTLPETMRDLGLTPASHG
jgi:hypothetical protein